MAGEQLPQRPDSAHPVESVDRSSHVVVWVTVGVNALLGTLTLA